MVSSVFEHPAMTQARIIVGAVSLQLLRASRSIFPLGHLHVVNNPQVGADVASARGEELTSLFFFCHSMH